MAQTRPGAALSSGPRASTLRPPQDSEDPYDALTELFLGEVRDQEDPVGSAPPAEPDPLPIAAVPAPPAATTSNPPAPPAPTTAAPAQRPVQVEGLILGHLPILAQAWAAQYARRAAETGSQPVAFARMQSGALTIDLMGLPAKRRTELRDPPTAPDDAVRRAAALTPRWIVRVDDLDESSLMRAPGVDIVTLLTSADEAAVVAAYRTLKRLTLAEDPEGRLKTKRLRIAVMGATQERAQVVADKLTGAAAAFLGRAIEIGHTIERIESGAPSVTLYRGRADLDAPSLLDLIRTAPTPAPQPEIKPSAPAPPLPGLDLAGALSSAAPQVPPHGLPAAPAAPAEPDELSLTRHVLGLTGLPARCPFAKDVELAIDVVGRAHVLVRAADTDPDVAVRVALIAAAWLTEHTELVGLTAPRGLKLESTRPPVRHVFIQQSKSASAMLRTGMRVHLVSRADNGRETSVELE